MRDISDTAYLVAMYRALATEHPQAMFQDPFARLLAGRRGEFLTEILGNKQQAIKMINIRTCVLDTMIQRLIISENVDTVINLGAGLDTRPYRLPLPGKLHWIEVDFPAILTYKEHKLVLSGSNRIFAKQQWRMIQNSGFALLGKVASDNSIDLTT